MKLSKYDEFKWKVHTILGLFLLLKISVRAQVKLSLPENLTGKTIRFLQPCSPYRLGYSHLLWPCGEKPRLPNGEMHRAPVCTQVQYTSLDTVSFLDTIPSSLIHYHKSFSLLFLYHLSWHLKLLLVKQKQFRINQHVLLNPAFVLLRYQILGDRWAAGKKTLSSPSVNLALIINLIQCQGEDQCLGLILIVYYFCFYSTVLSKWLLYDWRAWKFDTSYGYTIALVHNHYYLDWLNLAARGDCWVLQHYHRNMRFVDTRSSHHQRAQLLGFFTVLFYSGLKSLTSRLSVSLTIFLLCSHCPLYNIHNLKITMMFKTLSAVNSCCWVEGFVQNNLVLREILGIVRRATWIVAAGTDVSWY